MAWQASTDHCLRSLLVRNWVASTHSFGRRTLLYAAPTSELIFKMISYMSSMKRRKHFLPMIDISEPNKSFNILFDERNKRLMIRCSEIDVLDTSAISKLTLLADFSICSVQLIELISRSEVAYEKNIIVQQEISE